MQSIFFYHSGINLEINNGRKTGKFANLGQLNNTVLNNGPKNKSKGK